MPLLAAVVLASVLYAGLVVAQDTRSFLGPVAIVTVRAPTTATLLEPLGDVTAIRYRAPVDIAGRISAQSFHASADLSGIVPQDGGAPVQVGVRLVATDDRIQIIDFQPQIVTVRLDPVLEKTFQVSISRPGTPDGLTVGATDIQPGTVRVSGASSRVRSISKVEGNVTIDASAINVDTDVEIQPLDENGAVVNQVELQPERVHVKIEVAKELASRTVPVVPNVVGTPPAGFRVHAVTVEPLVVLVSGEQPTIATIEAVRTAPVDISQQAGPFETRVGLALPPEVSVTGVPDVLVSVDLRGEDGSRSIPVAVTPEGAERDVRYQLSTDQVIVALAGPVAALGAVDPRTLPAIVDVTGLDAGAYDLPIVVRAPSGTTLVGVVPQRLTVTITRPATPSPLPTPATPSAPVDPNAPPSPSPTVGTTGAVGRRTG
jgi:YbbR domain-containing protein